MRKFLFSLGSALAVGLLLPQTALANVTVSPQSALAQAQVAEAITGTPNQMSVEANLVYLFPAPVLSINEKVLSHYAKNPNLPYTTFLSYEDEDLYYDVGQYILPFQAQAETAYAVGEVVPSVLMSKAGITSAFTDTRGVYQAIFLQGFPSSAFRQFLSVQ